ncbi:MAG: hypothetical protein PGN25_20290 [Methylorubrum populi]
MRRATRLAGLAAPVVLAGPVRAASLLDSPDLILLGAAIHAVLADLRAQGAALVVSTHDFAEAGERRREIGNFPDSLCPQPAVSIGGSATGWRVDPTRPASSFVRKAVRPGPAGDAFQ